MKRVKCRHVQRWSRCECKRETCIHVYVEREKGELVEDGDLDIENE